MTPFFEVYAEANEVQNLHPRKHKLQFKRNFNFTCSPITYIPESRNDKNDLSFNDKDSRSIPSSISLYTLVTWLGIKNRPLIVSENLKNDNSNEITFEFSLFHTGRKKKTTT